MPPTPFEVQRPLGSREHPTLNTGIGLLNPGGKTRGLVHRAHLPYPGWARGVPAQTHRETPWPPGGSWLQGVWGGFLDPYRGLGGGLFTGSRVSWLMTWVGLSGGVYYGPGGFLGWGWAIGGFVGFFLFFEDVFLG